MENAHPASELRLHSDQAYLLLEMEREVMEMIATDEPIGEVLDKVAHNFEVISHDAICSILLVDEDGKTMRHGAGPSLPKAYCDAIDGESMGPVAGSCGTAAFHKKRVIVEDIASDPLWVNYRDVALRFGLKACWSTPIVSNDRQVLGTFAIYYKSIKTPDERDFMLIDRAVDQVKIALEKNHNAAQLIESEAKYRLLMESMPDYIMRFDQMHRYLYVNSATIKLTGLSESDFIGKTNKEIGFDPDLCSYWEMNIKQAFQTRKIIQTQFAFTLPQGEIFLDWRLIPEVDETGNVKSVLGVARDITQLKEAEKEIRKRERFLAIVTDNFPRSYLTVVGKNMEVLYNGGEEFSKSDLDQESFIGKTIQEIYAPFGKKVLDVVIQAYHKTMLGEPQMFELEINNEFQQYKTVPLVAEDNVINSILVVTENITDKKVAEGELVKSEFLFRGLASNAPIAIYQTDLEGRCTYVNEEWVRYSGISAEEAKGFGWLKAIHPDDRERVKQEWESFVVSSGTVFKSEMRMLQPTGRIVWLSAKALPLYGADHIAYGHIGIALDITDRKQINELLEENEERFRTTLERITDGFVALDKNWCYTYMNRRAGEIFDRDPNTMVGKHIWTEFPEGIGQPFHLAYEKAMKEQNYVYLEEYYPPYDRWFENHIYPSPEGLSIYFKDITDRKMAELQLIAINESLELAEEQAKLGNWEFNVKTQKRRWSKQMFRFFNLEPDANPPAMEAYLHLIHPEDRIHVQPSLLEMSNGAEPKMRMYRTNPDLMPLRYLYATWSVEKDSEGNPERFVGTLLDVTERIEIEKKIRESEEKYRTLIEQAADAIFLVDLEGNYLEANEGASVLTGYSIDELKRMNGRDLVWDEDLRKTPLQTEKIKEGQVVFIERVLKRKDNSLINVEITAKLMNSGKVNVIIRDVTERFLAQKRIRESEEKYRTLIEQASDAIFIADASTQLIQVNSSACQMTGYSQEELVQLSISDIVEIEPGDPPLRTAEVEKSKSLLQERKIKRKDGAIVPVEVNATRMNDGNILSIVRDITDRIRTHQQIRDYNIQLQQLTMHLQKVREEERASLSRELHDELGQQLTAIKMDLSWLNKKAVSNEMTDKLGEALEITNAAVSTVRRINSDLRPLLLDDLGLFAALDYQAKEFSKRYNAECHFRAEMIEPQLDQQNAIAIFRIFQETLTNVGKHAKATKVDAVIRSIDGMMELIISDNGVGFDMLEGKGLRSFGILGMTERAMMMNGVLEIESTPGKGTIVKLRVPI